MAVSSEIIAKLGLDTGSFEQQMARVPSMVERVDAQLKKIGIGSASGKSAKESAAAYEEIFAAEEKLANFRKQNALNQANTVGKIRLIETELQALAKQRADTEKGTARYLELQLEIEQRMAAVRSLRQTAGGQRASGVVADRALADRNALTPPLIEANTLMGKLNVGVNKFKDALKSSGGGQLAATLGIGALVAGYTNALNRAQALRDEAEKLQRPLNAGTRAVAEYADAIDSLKTGVSDLAVGLVSIPVRIGQAYGTAQAAILGLLQGRSIKETLNTIKITEEAGRNADRLAAGREEAAKRGEENARERAREKQRIEREAAAEKKRADEEEMRALNQMYQNDRERAAAVKTLTDFERNERRAKLSDEQLLGELAQDQARLAKEIGDYEKFRRQQGELTAEGAQDLLSKKQQQVEVEQKILQLTESKLKKEKATSEEVARRLAKLNEQAAREATLDSLQSRNFIINGRVFGPGADPDRIKDASDESLRELVRRRQADVQFVEKSKGVGPTALTDIATNFLLQGSVLARLQTDIQRANAELAQRNQLRSDVAYGGQENALRRFQGDPLAFDGFYQRFGTQQDETLRKLTEINETLKNRGIAIRSLPTGTPAGGG